jgi:arginase family enzyme
MEEGIASRLLQFGIRTMSPHQREQADRFGVEVFEYRDWDHVVPPLSGPVYVTIDMDALDPAFAPGVSHHEPGGMSTRELLGAIRQIADSGAVVVGADIVELNPQRDVNDVTAMVAAKLARELLGLLITARS